MIQPDIKFEHGQTLYTLNGHKIKQGFDLFNLIDENLAIDAATLNLESKEN